MIPSEPERQRAIEILDRFAALFDEHELAESIDRPIERAFREYDCPESGAISHRQFIYGVAKFLCHLYARAFPQGRQLSLSQACDEAIALLEQSSQGPFSSGYIDARVDAVDPALPGFPLVLARVADLVKERLRQLRVQACVVRLIEPADWTTKCAMASVLLESCRPYLPWHLKSAPPEQLANHLVLLLMVERASRGRSQANPARIEDPFD